MKYRDINVDEILDVHDEDDDDDVYCNNHYYFYDNFIWRIKIRTAPAVLLRNNISIDWVFIHYNEVIMGVMASQITNLTVVYSTVYSGTDQRKHRSSASLAFVRGIHRSPVNSPHKRPVTRKMFPSDDVIMKWCNRESHLVLGIIIVRPFATDILHVTASFVSISALGTPVFIIISVFRVQ